MDLDADAERAAMLLRKAKQQRLPDTCDVLAQTRNTGPRASAGPALRFIEATVAGSDTALLLPPSSERRRVPPGTTALLSRRRGNGRLQGRRVLSEPSHADAPSVGY